MCRNIRTLHNFDPPATDAEIRSAALQFVRKISGYNAPSQVNEEAFATAVDDVTGAVTKLLTSLEASRPPRDRAAEAEKARARSRARFVRII